MKIYMIGGKARHGKDTFAAFLKKYFEEYGQKVCIMQISSHIKHFAINYFGFGLSMLSYLFIFVFLIVPERSVVTDFDNILYRVVEKDNETILHGEII